jgi:hypothetical protein
VVVLHDVAGVAVPEIAKLVVPEGAIPPLAPVTVPVKVNTPPKVGVEIDDMVTVGVPLETVVADDDETAATG